MAGKARKPPEIEGKPCDVCGKKIQICSKCTDCDDYLCYNCTVAHKGSKLSKHHKIVEYGGGVVKKTEYCLDHPSEEIHMFCSQCLEAVCKVCIISLHNAHTFSDLRSVANIKREEIASRVTSIQDRYLPQLHAQVVAVEKIIKENETKGENRVKQIKDRGDNIRGKVQEIETSRITESRQKENRNYNRLVDTRNEINKCVEYLKSLINESESRIKGGSDVEILRSAKQLLSIDLEAEVETKVKLKENLDLVQHTFECEDVSQKVLENCVGYLKEEDSEAEKCSDIDTETIYANLVPGLPSLIDMSEINILPSLFTVYNQRTFSQNQLGALIRFGVQLSHLLERKVSPALCRDPTAGDNIITLYFALGDFLHFSGHFKESETVYRGCIRNLSGLDDTDLTLSRRYQCLVKLLDVRVVTACYRDAQITCTEALTLLKTLKSRGVVVNSANLCALQAHLLFTTESKYAKAQDLCDEAMKQLSDQLPPETILNVLHLCMKVSYNADNLKKASVLIKFATEFAQQKFGDQHPMYAQSLDYYGGYLLKVDLADFSVETYEHSLKILTEVFEPSNVLVARSDGELAYALYVKEYTTGKFSKAREHATKAISVLTESLPRDSMLPCFSFRSKALILEEIALDSDSTETKNKLLKEAESLHLKSLKLSKNAIGEKCITTSNHYGNLGRLYQSMKKLKEAEEMLLKSVKIYEELLGADSSELALKLGHLASLYVYDLHQYDKAERLYHRSISIITKTYGGDYSGLEYDYRGLIYIYEKTGKKTKEKQYRDELKKWQDSQTKTTKSRDSMITDIPSDLNSVIKMYFRMKK